MSQFIVEIANTSDDAFRTAALLGLPATWSEYMDAIQRARVDGLYVAKLCDYKEGSIAEYIREPVDLPELNLLAQHLDALSEDEAVLFHVIATREAIKEKDRRITTDRLINIAHSLDGCHLFYGIKNDAQIGRFLHENDLVEGDAEDSLHVEQNIKRFGDNYAAILGREHREQNNGIVFNEGYVIPDEIKDIYAPLSREPFQEPTKPLTLELSNGQGKKHTLYMPYDTVLELRKILAALVGEGDEPVLATCGECLIPAAAKLIEQEQDFSCIQSFAQAITELKKNGQTVLYKALYETLNPKTLEAATALTAQIGEYDLSTVIDGPEMYATVWLNRNNPSSVNTERLQNLHGLGNELMKVENAENTTYGILRRKDGGPIQPLTENPRVEQAFV